jgi:hypothetical protein
VNWRDLSQSATWTLRYLAVPISLGYSSTEVAQAYGESTAWVAKRLSKLRNEIEQQG